MAPPFVVAGPLAAPSLKLLLHPARPRRGLGGTPIRLMRTVKGLTANRIPPTGSYAQHIPRCNRLVVTN